MVLSKQGLHKHLVEQEEDSEKEGYVSTAGFHSWKRYVLEELIEINGGIGYYFSKFERGLNKLTSEIKSLRQEIKKLKETEK